MEAETIDLPEAIPGLRAALAAERAAESALASVHRRLEAANYAHATARAYRGALVQRSAAGEPVPPGELVAAQAAIDEARAAVDTFPDVTAASERAVAKARGNVTATLRSEMHRRRDLAQAALTEAERRASEAARARANAAEELQRAVGAASQDGDFLRTVLSTEIAAVS